MMDRYKRCPKWALYSSTSYRQPSRRHPAEAPKHRHMEPEEPRSLMQKETTGDSWPAVALMDKRCQVQARPLVHDGESMEAIICTGVHHSRGPQRTLALC